MNLLLRVDTFWTSYDHYFYSSNSILKNQELKYGGYDKSCLVLPFPGNNHSNNRSTLLTGHFLCAWHSLSTLVANLLGPTVPTHGGNYYITFSE